MKPDGFGDRRDLQTRGGEQREVSVHVVGVSTVDADKLIDHVGAVG